MVTSGPLSGKLATIQELRALCLQTWHSLRKDTYQEQVEQVKFVRQKIAAAWVVILANLRVTTISE